MIVSRLLAVILSTSVVAIRPISAQSTWCAYRPGTLRSIIDEHQSTLKRDLPPEHRNDLVSMDTRPTRAAVVYLGATRPLTGLDSAFMDGYFYRAIRDSSFRKHFSRQALFSESSDTLWLAIQDSLIPALNAEVGVGGPVTVFARWLGAVQLGSQTTWLFTVNEFASPVSQPTWDRLFAECGSS